MNDPERDLRSMRRSKFSSLTVLNDEDDTFLLNSESRPIFARFKSQAAQMAFLPLFYFFFYACSIIFPAAVLYDYKDCHTVASPGYTAISVIMAFFAGWNYYHFYQANPAPAKKATTFRGFLLTHPLL